MLHCCVGLFGSKLFISYLGKIIGVGKEEAFLLILCPFCLRNRSDGVKAINYLIDICKFDKVGCTPVGEMGSIRKWALT